MCLRRCNTEMKDIFLSDWVCMGDPPPPALTHTQTVHCTHTPVCSVLPASYCAYTLPLSAPTLSHLSTTSQPCCCMETCCSLIWARPLHRLSASCNKSQSIKKKKINGAWFIQTHTGTQVCPNKWTPSTHYVALSQQFFCYDKWRCICYNKHLFPPPLFIAPATQNILSECIYSQKADWYVSAHARLKQ